MGGCCGPNPLDSFCHDKHGEGFLPFLVGFLPYAILVSAVSVFLWLIL